MNHLPVEQHTREVYDTSVMIELELCVGVE